MPTIKAKTISDILLRNICEFIKQKSINILKYYTKKDKNNNRNPS